MTRAIAAALALTAASSLHAQTVAPPPGDLSYATPLTGRWTYAPVADGSEATFNDAYGRPQLFVRCSRSTRRVSIQKPASVAAPFLSLWTSSLTRNLPTSFNPATGRLSADLAAYDGVLDSIATSRGRVGISVSGSVPLVVPPWGEINRVIEDCRV